jgi:acetyltransferase-like isoleucine patch superfamily enzyme
VQLGGGTFIGEGVWIGLNSTINNKIRIGKWAVVGSGSMVIRNVSDYALVAGNPAKYMRDRRSIREDD